MLILIELHFLYGATVFRYSKIINRSQEEPEKPGKPDKGCAFHPESPKCPPDENGNCPPNFGHNDNGHCFPSGSCPGGFGRHDDDDSGKCFSPCPHGFHMKNGHCNKDIVLVTFKDLQNVIESQEMA